MHLGVMAIKTVTPHSPEPQDQNLTIWSSLVLFIEHLPSGRLQESSTFLNWKKLFQRTLKVINRLKNVEK